MFFLLFDTFVGFAKSLQEVFGRPKYGLFASVASGVIVGGDIGGIVVGKAATACLLDR